MTRQDVFPPLLGYAITLEPSEVAAVEAAGGTLIGFQATRRGYSPRAASVGGTHFVAVAGDVTAHTSCAAPFVGGVAYSFCSTRAGYRPTKVAVYRVEVGQWSALPPHLVPPTDDLVRGIWAPVTRDGCQIRNAWGIVKCNNAWQLRTWPPLVRARPAKAEPVPSAAQSSTSSPPQEVVGEPAAAEVPTNPY